MNPRVFKMYDLRGRAETDFPDDEVVRLGQAIGAYFTSSGQTRAIVARDNRYHSPRLREAIIKGLTSTGVSVLDIGQTITPVFYFAHQLYGYRAGVMITASHNPPGDNGFKIYLGEGTIYGQEIARLRDIMEQGDFPQGTGRVASADPEEEYVSHIASRIQLARPIKIAVDAGNGAAGPTACRLFRALGCQILPLHCEPDSTFPHHHPDPTVPANLSDLIETVRRQKAEAGVSFDGDGDRLGVVDESGHVLWGDILQVLFWREIMPRHPGAPAIVEVKCSQVLYDEIERLGGKPFFYKTGHSLIKAKMREIKAPFTGEMSGHFFFADEYFGYDDALYASSRLFRILAREKRPLSALLSDLPTVYATPETRVPCPDERKAEVVAAIVRRFRDQGYPVNDVDGARVKLPSGWCLVRASNTQPVLVARCEASTRKDLKAGAALLKRYLMECGIGDFDWELP